MRRPSGRPRFEIRAAVRAWLLKDDAVKKFTSEREEDRGMILDYLQRHGTQDEKGNFWINWPEDPVEGRVKAIKAERRVGRTFDMETAEEWLKEHGLYDKCTERITILSEDKVIGLNFVGIISDEDFEKLYATTETFAFVPQRIKL
jgi:hypothetical protein